MPPKNSQYANEQHEEDIPLLNNSSSTHEGYRADTIFAIDDDLDNEDVEDIRPLSSSKQPTQNMLRSTVASREAEFELDSDELEDGHGPYNTLANGHSHGNLSRHASAPFLVGLVDSSHARHASQDFQGRVVTDQQYDLEELAKQRLAGGGMLDSVANMANSILGAGIIGLPYAIRQAGFVTGIILLVVLTIITDWTIRLIVTNAKMSGQNTYIGIMKHCFGEPGRALISIFQFAFAFGGMCAFGIIIGDTIPQVIRSLIPGLTSIPVLNLLGNRQFVIGLCTIGISYPLSLHRDIHKLARASGLALIGMLIIVISVLIERENVTSDLKGDPNQRFSIVQPQIAQAIGVISFAFVCHHNSLLIYGSLRTPTMDRFATVTHISTAISLVCCFTLAVSAYLVFTDKTQGNVLNNFAVNDTIINVARFCFGLNMFTTLPLELFVCREVIEQYFFPDEGFNYHRHILFTTSILFASMFISMITCDLGVTLEITGGVSATALAFIFPAICYVKLLPGEIKWHSKQKFPAIACCTFGICVLVLSIFLSFFSESRATKICV